MSKTSQNEKVLKYLRTHKRGITSMEAIQKLRITRLSGRIYDLKQIGHVIDSEWVTKKDEHGEVKRFTRYTLIKDKEKAPH